MNKSSLYHYGMPRRSGRYPYGSGDRPYQSEGGGGQSRSSESIKKETLQKGSASDVLKYAGNLSNKELQAAVMRLNLEANLKSLSAKEHSVTPSYIDSIVGNIKIGTGWVISGLAAYNTIARIYNITPQGREHPLPKI